MCHVTVRNSATRRVQLREAGGTRKPSPRRIPTLNCPLCSPLTCYYPHSPFPPLSYHNAVADVVAAAASQSSAAFVFVAQWQATAKVRFCSSFPSTTTTTSATNSTRSRLYKFCAGVPQRHRRQWTAAATATEIGRRGVADAREVGIRRRRHDYHHILLHVVITTKNYHKKESRQEEEACSHASGVHGYQRGTARPPAARIQTKPQ